MFLRQLLHIQITARTSAQFLPAHPDGIAGHGTKLGVVDAEVLAHPAVCLPVGPLVIQHGAVQIKGNQIESACCLHGCLPSVRKFGFLMISLL